MSLKISDKMYDMLKWVAMYLLPALGTLYFALSGIWGLPYGEQIVGTITAFDTFLAVILGLSKAGYDGDACLELDTTDPEKDGMTIAFYDVDPVGVMKNKKYVTMKVTNKMDS